MMNAMNAFTMAGWPRRRRLGMSRDAQLARMSAAIAKRARRQARNLLLAKRGAYGPSPFSGRNTTNHSTQEAAQ